MLSVTVAAQSPLQPVLAADSPLPSTCERWCASNVQAWSDKCRWKKRCSGCSECSELQPSPGHLRSSTGEGAGSKLQPSPEQETALRFQSSECRRLLDNARASGWQQVCSWNRAGLHRGQHIYRTQPETGRDLYYVRNEKAASQFMIMELNTLFNATAVSSRFKDGGLERRYAPFVSEHGAGFPTAEQPDELVMFTVVREPIQTAFDAYLEVIHRTKFPRAQNDAETSQLDVELYHEFLHATNGSALRSFVNWGQGRGKKSPPPAWSHVSCDTAEDAREKFGLYLDALEAGQDCGAVAYHSYPQAMKIDVVSPQARWPRPRHKHRYDAIVKVEDLTEGLERVGVLAGTPAVTVPPPAKREAHSNGKMSCGRFGIGTELTRRLCKLYAADYECFGYELPEDCRT